jgi:hypothetical protein
MNSETNNQMPSSIMVNCFLQATPCLYERIYALLHQRDAYLRTLHIMCS